jgi:hypothetical protein
MEKIDDPFFGVKNERD